MHDVDKRLYLSKSSGKKTFLFNVTAARNNFFYLMLSSALVFVEVAVLNHDSATEEDKLKKEKGNVKNEVTNQIQ